MSESPRPPQRERSASLIELAAAALVIGTVTGFLTVGLRAVVAAIHNLFFLGEFSFYYNPNLHTPYGWLGPLVVLSPAVGGLAVICLMRLQPPDRRGQGVSDIIDAIYNREGLVRSLSAIVKSLAAGIQSGTGGSVGLEAASVQIGAALSSRFGRLIRLEQWQRLTLVAAGAAAGLAAAFNAPLGATVFAIELMMPEISARTLLPVTIAAGAGTFVSRFYNGLQPTFLVETVTATHFRLSGVLSLLPYAVFGIVLGFASWLMIWLVGWVERKSVRISPTPILRHVIGMTFVGLIFYGLMLTTGHYYVQGPSYALLQDILRGEMTALWLFLLLFVAKLVASVVTIGSGGSGGTFSAALVLGGTLGGAMGVVTQTAWPDLNTSITDFAIVGMAGMLGGTIGAAMTAIVMVFELTRDYNVIVPMILVVTIAITVRRALLRQSIYTWKLVEEGREVPDSLQASVYRIRKAERSMSTDFKIYPASATLDEAITALEETGRPLYIMIGDGRRLAGYLRLDPGFKLWEARDANARLGDVARTDYTLARPTDTMTEVIGRLSRHGARLAIVVRPRARVPRVEDIAGVIALETMGESVIDAINPFAPRRQRNPFPRLYRGRVFRPIERWRRWRARSGGDVPK
ncbi:MAG TPA: chloride channel protein [Stellaceae bacterium]|nr:chloride channel protein [Stellaceae bacterium]